MSFFDDLNKTKKKLDSISCSFCAAKWLQVSLHLQNGHTHSCHHPDTHKIPLDEIKKDAAALYNTKYKKELRKQMLEGERPQECGYCWNIEDLSSKNISDRHIKSNDWWAAPHIDAIAKQSWKKNFNPTYVEVSFSSKCNFKCLYCLPHISSSWHKEISENGHYLFGIKAFEHLESVGKLPIYDEETNPYIKAFWESWPDLYKSLKVFRITGGEPLLSPNTFKVLDYIRDNPNPALEVAINSNLGVPSTLVRQFGQKIKALKENQSAKDIRVYTSLDTWGPQAEYIRTGLKLSLMQKNIDLLLEEVPNLNLTVMCTFNALSVPQFKVFLSNILHLKQKFAQRGGELLLDISYLRDPNFLSVLILPWVNRVYFRELTEFMEAYRGTPQEGFTDYEISKMQRLADYFTEASQRPLDSEIRQKFIQFVDEYDRRSGKTFTEIFPELADIYFSWKLQEFDNGSILIKPCYQKEA